MRRINTGDVIAVAVDGVGLPPVGRVVDCDDDAVEIALYSFLSGYFGAGSMLIRHRDIRATVWAAITQHHPPTDLETDDETVAPVVFDMDPLASFQTRWRVA